MHLKAIAADIRKRNPAQREFQENQKYSTTL